VCGSQVATAIAIWDVKLHVHLESIPWTVFAHLALLDLLAVDCFNLTRMSLNPMVFVRMAHTAVLDLPIVLFAVQ
jgi:hypothetical protein